MPPAHANMLPVQHKDKETLDVLLEGQSFKYMLVIVVQSEMTQ